MAAPKTRKVNKSAFVRSFPKDTPAADIIAKAKAQGFTMSAAHVYAIRSKDNQTSKGGGAVAAKRVGRPPKSLAAGRASSGSIEAEIERIVERKVAEVLRARLGSMFG